MVRGAAARGGHGDLLLSVLILTVLQGPDKGKRYELPDHEPQLIGRSSEALPISDSTVSRRHAELTPDDGQWYIRDLQSQNGTYVNGVRIAQRMRLRPGDQVRTGATLFVFGVTESRDPDIIRVLRPDQISTTVEKKVAGRLFESDPNEESMLLAEPEPRAAAVDHLRVIYQLTTLTAQQTDRQELLRAVLDLVFSEFKPERGFIMTLEEAGGAEELKTAVVKYRMPPLNADEAKIHVPRTILQAAVRQGEGLLSSNAMSDPRFAAGDSVQQMQVRSAICAPIKYRERVYGAIYIDSTVANYTFTAGQLALMNAVGQQTGLALANAELYAQKVQTERLAAIGETVASLSHSIKNMLQGLRGGADVVEMGLKKDDLKIAKGGWPILKRNLDRIIGLTMNMLAYSRHRTAEFELTPVGALIDDCIELLKTPAQGKRIAMITDVDPELPPVPLDQSLIHQALMNLLGNAVEAVEPERGVVTVRALFHPPSAAPARVEIIVIDNGPGIPKGKQQWIFEPFNTTKGLRGTGLGLAVAKRIAEEHAGSLSVESDEGRGATFRLVLPIDPDRAIDPSATTGQGKDAPPREPRFGSRWA